LVTFDGPSSATLSRFGDYLTSADGQTALAAAGLRTSASAPATATLDAAGLIAASGGKPAVAVPTAAVVTMAQTFGFMHTRVSSLVVLDASGSMKDRLPGSTTRKIDLVKALAQQTLTVASPQARSGVVTFRSDARDTIEIKLAARLLANGSDDGGLPHATRVLQAVNSAPIGGGTPLYNAIVFGYQKALASYDAKFVNQVVVLTDGDNRDARGSISRAALVSQLKALKDPKRPLKLILLGYGQDADMTTLRAIASATGGKAVAVPTLASVAEATRQALFTP
jgi:Mg-chelatase subunit ChlD